MMYSEERIEVSDNTEQLEIRIKEAESFLNNEMKNNREIYLLLIPFLLFIAICFLYVSWFNFWSVLIILFMIICVLGLIGILFENIKFKKYKRLIYTDSSCLEEVETLLQNKKKQDERQASINNLQKEKQAIAYKNSHPQCPNCGSTNTSQISNMNRATSVAVWGLASSKIGKQYECKSCKHKW